VHLPSGSLIGISVAVAVAAAVVLVRIQRRRRYRPGLTVPPLAESPLPEVITALRRAARPALPPDDETSSPDELPDGDPYLDLYQPDDADPDAREPDTARPGPEPASLEPRFVPAPALPQTTGAHPRPAAASASALSPILPAGDPDLDLYAASADPGALCPARGHGQAANDSTPARFSAAGGTSSPAPPPQPASPAAISLGVRGDSPASLEIAALGGLGLTGPGAGDAARAILATLLTQTPPGQPGLPAEVILPAVDAASLLPGQDTAGIPGLSVPASLEDALAQMEAALLRQARTTHTAGPDGAPPAGPGTTLIATCGTSSCARLRAITQAGRGLGVTTVVLGAWPDGSTCQVAADGVVTTVTPADPRLEGLRLFHLGGSDATAITAVLREAHGAYLPAPSAPDGPPAVTAPDDPPARPPAADGGHHRPAHAPASAPAPARRTGPAGDPGSSPGQDAAADPDRPAGSTVPAVQLDLLGPLQITAGGQEVSSGMRKARELLALLAVHRDGISGEAINEALWRDLDPGHATRQRNLALRKARELLRTATGLAGPMWVLLSAGRYHLDPGLISADLWQFHDALHQAQHTADPGQQLDACQHAVALYRGELAEAAGYEWAEPAAEAARHLALYAWTKIADLLQVPDPGQALAALETAVRHDPYNEFLYQRIMRLQADTGHPDAVRRTLSLLESQLTHLGVTPGTQTRQVAATLLGAHSPARVGVGSRRS
jgi:DNA-binding SARP family transcriptional activator